MLFQLIFQINQEDQLVTDYYFKYRGVIRLINLGFIFGINARKKIWKKPFRIFKKPFKLMKTMPLHMQCWLILTI